LFDWEADTMHPPEHTPQRQPDPAHRDEQMTLFTHGAHPTTARTRLSRNERMAVRLEQLADDWEEQAEQERAAGDQLSERRLREQARDARRSAALLRAGPGGVSRLLAS
jgi:hypothetical protein